VIAGARVRAGMMCAWRGPSLLVLSDRGVAGRSEPLSGYYVSETRVLNVLALTINGRDPWLCESATIAPDRLAFDYIYPEISAPGGGGTGFSDDGEHVNDEGIPERALGVRVDFRVRAACLEVAVVIANRSLRKVSVQLAFEFDADFADIQEAQSGKREQSAAVTREADDADLWFTYEHPSLRLRSDVRFDEGWQVSGRCASADLVLVPRDERRLTFRVIAHMPEGRLDDEESERRERFLREWVEHMTAIEVPGNRLAERIIESNIQDLASFPLLTGPREEWLAPQAGMPLYPAFFGRDALTAGWQAAFLDRGRMLDAALTRLGRMQADRDDAWRDAEPGRVPYQMRSGPLARLNINPYSAYYADFASPLMFVIALGNLFAWTGDRDIVRRHWDAARRVLDWARERGDRDGDGYLEYASQSSQATKNQGWKDSGDAIIYDDGTPVPSPIATCELQGYWYAAQMLMSVLALAMGERDIAIAYARSAADLHARFNRDWWVEREGFFALALDPDKRQVGAATSNVGHCLAAGIIDRAHVPPVVGRLFAPDMFSGWGIRTLSSSHCYYDPVSYHRGTVWAVEQATIVFGLRRFGFDARAIDLSRGLFDLAELYPEYRIPECVGGYSRAERPVPGAYPRSNTPQLWNTSAFPLIVQSLLGLLPLAPTSTLIVDPVLPEWMPEVVIRGLRVGDASATFRFVRREDGHTDWDVLHKQGTLHVIRQQPPESLTAGAIDRTSALMESLR